MSTFGQFMLNGELVKKNYIDVFGMEDHVKYNRKVIYTGTDGGDSSRKFYEEKKGLVVGQEYETEYLNVSSSTSSVKLKGIEGMFNTVCFHVL